MLSAVERKIEQFVKEVDSSEVVALYKKLPQGKRLRAKLILKIAGSSLQTIKTAAIVEMIHAASLLHDDVIDDAHTRRNRPSINALYGNKTAIMLGDILYSKGFFELNNINREVSMSISNAVTQLSLGELADVSLSKEFNSDKTKYMQMIYQKTASLIEASAASAAILAGKKVEPYRVYGRNLGLAFQMMDDLLDITADSTTLGKPASHDYAEGKCTLPYIYLYEKLSNEEKIILKSLHKKHLSNSQQDWIRTKMQEHNIIMLCYNEAKKLVDDAVVLMQSAGERELEAIARDMIDRSF